MHSESIDPNDGRAVFNALQRRVDGALEGWRCLRAVPRIDGTMYFDLESGEEKVRLNWVRGRLESLAGSDSLINAVEEELARCLEEEQFALLRYYNRDLAVLRFDDRVVDALLAGRFAPMKTSWFGYRFETVFQEAGNKFRIAFEGDRGKVVIEVKAAGSEPDGRVPLYENRLFSMFLEEDCRLSDERGQVAHQVERFLGFLLNRAVHERMRLEDQGGAGASGPVSSGRWGNPSQWFQFFSDHEIECSNLCSLQLADPVSWVNHGELECMDHEPHVLSATVGYANTPWFQKRTLGPPGTRFLVSRLLEEDAVRGGSERLEATLQKALQNPDARFVCVSNTCLPKIIGDDVGSIVARYQKSSPVPILLLNNDLSSPDRAYENLVLQAIRQFAANEEVGERSGVNLVGFPPGRGDMLAELEKIGISHNVSFLPEIGVEILQKCPRGKLSVVYPYAPWLRIVEGGLKDLLQPVVVLPAPYGFRRTREWLGAVASGFGRQRAYSQWESERAEPLAREWNRLTDEAESCGLGFVVHDRNMDRLIDARKHYGFEMLTLFEEMGFRLHVMIQTSSPDQTLPVERFTAGLTEPGRHTFRGFSRPDELAAMLESDDFQALYSEIFYDSRIIEAGKAQFTLSMIEMGLEGALRSLKRLLRICRLEFYRRYRRYL